MSPPPKEHWPHERTPPQNLTTDTLPPCTSPKSDPDTDDPRRGVARYPLAGSQRRYGTCWLASDDTIIGVSDACDGNGAVLTAMK